MKSICYLIFYLFLVQSAWASVELKAKLDLLMLRDPVLSQSRVGISVRSLDRQKTLYEWNGHKPLNPASNIKVLTTSVALKELGLHYQFKTTFYTDRQLPNGQINHLYIKGGGDPLLVMERIWRIVGDLRNRGLRGVQGNIIVDGSFFDQEIYPPGWPANPGHQAYYAPNAAFAVNFNSVAVFVIPGKNPGDTPEVVMDPKIPWLKLQVNAQTVSSHTAKTIAIERISQDGGDTIRVSGKIPINSQPFIKYRNLSKPLIYSGEVFKEMLSNRGISIKGSVQTGKIPENVSELFVEESPPLAHMIQDVNKLSNNFMAEQILKTLAAEKFGPPGSTSKGVEILKRHLDQLHISRQEYDIDNGSGLSARTRISPNALVSVLESAWLNSTLRPEFVSSLALGGVDGTLEERNIESEKNGILVRVRAKTGSLKDDGVSCISGYLSRPDGETWAFSILMNHLGKRYLYSHRAQDQIIGILLNHRG